MKASGRLVAALALTLGAGVTTMSAASSAGSNNGSAAPVSPTFTKDVLPILQKSCRWRIPNHAAKNA
jgi:hypothetical protein